MTIKEPPSGAWRNPLNGNAEKVMQWLARSLILVLCWIALDVLNTTRAEARQVREEISEISERLTKLETLRPEDSRRLARVENMVERMAIRMGVEP